jgi:DNA-binding SARP family transcriptional activator
MWSEYPEHEALRKLRTALHRVRRTLCGSEADASNFLLVDQSSVGIDTRWPYWIDVEAFEQHVLAAESSARGPGDPERGRLLREALSIYRGVFLEGEYHEWCLVEQDRLQALHVRALELLFDHYLHRCDWQRARLSGMELVQRNPLQESVHRKLMILYYLTGNRPLALRQFLECRAILERELSVTPMFRTVSLNDALRSENTNRIEELAAIELMPNAGDRESLRPNGMAESSYATIRGSVVDNLQSVVDRLAVAREKLLDEIRGIEGRRPQRKSQ